MYQMLQITYISQSSSTQYRSRNCDFHVFFYLYLSLYQLSRSYRSHIAISFKNEHRNLNDTDLNNNFKGRLKVNDTDLNFIIIAQIIEYV